VIDSRFKVPKDRIIGLYCNRGHIISSVPWITTDHTERTNHMLKKSIIILGAVLTLGGCETVYEFAEAYNEASQQQQRTSSSTSTYTSGYGSTTNGSTYGNSGSSYGNTGSSTSGTSGQTSYGTSSTYGSTSSSGTGSNSTGGTGTGLHLTHRGDCSEGYYWEYWSKSCKKQTDISACPQHIALTECKKWVEENT